jgi:hypothetical protein
MKKAIIFLVGIIFLIQSCEEDFDPPMEYLGSNYYIYNKGWRQNYITYSKNLYVIGYGIIGYNYDSIFIIAKQKPFDRFIDSLKNINLYIRYEEERKLYKEYQTYHYWIINKIEEREKYWDTINAQWIYTKGVYGPLSYERNKKKRRELNIPDSLRLRNTEKIRYKNIFHYLFGRKDYMVAAGKSPINYCKSQVRETYSLDELIKNFEQFLAYSRSICCYKGISPQDSLIDNNKYIFFITTIILSEINYMKVPMILFRVIL